MKIKLVRFGGLSSVDYKNFYRGAESFHRPPARHGIYAFIYPYIEDFLWVWRLKNHGSEKRKELAEEEYRRWFNKQHRQMKRIFLYEGAIWCHHVDVVRGNRSGSWVLTDTADLVEAMDKVVARDRKQLNTDCGWRGGYDPNIKDPYKRGKGGYMSMDHLEVFIEKKDLKGIS